ncbi:unnamed protein product [Staurois parvus]|uniref:Uncharacterized protein n=1 Tax=Staurois parvus TaxID=386267 RepID=A0ABN9CS63_9NEOB|nr:unnamed protein product [Staurois parvus]
MHSPKRENTTSLAIHTKLSMCSVSTQCRIRREVEDQRRQNQTAFFTQCGGLTP